MSDTYQVIVIGCGGLGSAALYRLARELGSTVLGIEQFQLGHNQGASDDHSRIVRLAQTKSEYGALSPASYESWYEVEEESGQQLLWKTGAVMIEPTEGDDVRRDGSTSRLDSRATVFDHYGHDYEWLEPSELMARWPQYTLRGSERAMYQQDSGLVDARRANAVHIALARAYGAQILEHTPVRSIRPDGGGVEVICDERTYRADRVVVTSAAWTNQVLAETGVQIPFTVTQEQVTYYATPNLRDFSLDRFPVFHWYGKHNYYGFPIYGEVATKIGEDMGGHEVTATTRDFIADPERQSRYRDFLERYLPRFLGPELYTKTCLYTVPPDRDFVLGTLPEHPQISVVIGAGHAFKFAALIGEILRDLAIDGTSGHPIDAFRVDRPELAHTPVSSA